MKRELERLEAQREGEELYQATFTCRAFGLGYGNHAMYQIIRDGDNFERWNGRLPP